MAPQSRRRSWSLAASLALGIGVSPAGAPKAWAEDTTGTSTESDSVEASKARAAESAERAAEVEAKCCAQLKGELRTSVTSQEADRAIRERRCCETVAQAYEQINSEPAPKASKDQSPNTPHETSFVGAVLQMILVLGAICLLAYLVLGKLVPKLLRIEPPVAQRRLLQVVDRLAVDQRRSIVVIKIGADYFLVGIADGGISLISRLDGDDVAAALATSDVVRPPKLGLLAKAVLGRSQKES